MSYLLTDGYLVVGGYILEIDGTHTHTHTHTHTPCTS